MDLTDAEMRALAERVFARRDVPGACAGPDLAMIITILKAHGITQGQVPELAGIAQGPQRTGPAQAGAGSLAGLRVTRRQTRPRSLCAASGAGSRAGASRHDGRI